MLLAYVVDSAEQLAPDKKRRVEVNITSDTLRARYKVIVEEMEEHEKFTGRF
jgi:hypothetical protein